MTRDATTSEIAELVERARRLRIRILTMVGTAKAGHLGGSLSAVELLTALYFRHLRVDPSNPGWPDRDRFILSKGHATPGYYTTLSARGYFPDSWLETYDSVGSHLQGHPDMTKTPGVDMTTGSLGQGFSASVGMCIGARLLGKSFRVVVITGDGEMQEGQAWEAAMYAGARGLSNLVCIVDNNGLQLASTIHDGLPASPTPQKWEAFGWRVLECDGNDMADVVRTLDPVLGRADDAGGPAHAGGLAPATSPALAGGPPAPPSGDRRPVAIIARTLKGKGVSFMEQVVKWHSNPPTRAEVAAALKELGASTAEVTPWLS